MTQVDLSVVIPAHNKAGVIGETVQSLAEQTLVESAFEVILVDDGSSDGMAGLIRAERWPFALRQLRQSHQGAGAARNLGAGAAAGDILLFLDADMVASPVLLEAHRSGHQAYDRAILAGRIRPWTSAANSPAFEIFAQSFDLGPESRRLSYGFGLTGNLSVKRKHFAAIGGFDEDIPRGQDIAFAHRAVRGGYDLFYWPQASAYHNHTLDLGQLCTKVRQDHLKLALLLQKYPELAQELDYLRDKLPISWRKDTPRQICRKLARRLLALAPARVSLCFACLAVERVWPSRHLLEFLVWKTLGSFQLLGLREGLKEYGQTG